MMQPNVTIDWLFVRSFCEEDEQFEMDFPVILRDFLMHEVERIPEYSGYIYADDDFAKVGAIEGIRYKFFNLLLSAARHGSSFSAEMICRIYKIYYKREYNQLKRFKTLSYDELHAFDYEGELFATTAARIITVSAFMGIEVLEDCEEVLPEAEDILNDESMEFKFSPEPYDFGDGVFEQSQKDAEELMKRIDGRKTRKNSDPLYFDDAKKFKWEVFSYHGVPASLDIYCDAEREPVKRQYAVTIALLKTMWPDRTFTDEDIQKFRALYEQLSLLVSQLSVLDEMIDYMIGRTDKFSFEMEHCRYQPGIQKVVRAVPGRNEAPAKFQPAAAGVGTEKSVDTEDLYKEIEKLRASLKAKDQTIGQISRMYREASQKAKEEQIDTESWDDDRAELARLREHVYQMTEADLQPETVPEETMVAALRDRRIVIVGGHDNWVHFLKEKFPSWTYIKPGIANTVPESAVMNAEYLFFFTDTLSHGAYGKFIHVARIHSIPFGYLHGTNIPGTVRQIYSTMNPNR